MEFEEVAVPTRGRYVRQPVVADYRGLVSVPPALPRTWPKIAGAGVALLALAAGINFIRRNRRQKY